jgi:RHS repeat-associated protein
LANRAVFRVHSRRRSVTISSVIPFRAIRLLTVVAALLFASAASASIPCNTRDLSPIVAAYWLYDTAGNRVCENNGISGSITNRFCNGLNQFWSLPYDADGNMLSDGVFAYTWDAENRLVGVASNGISVASYLYDSQNRRISKTANGVTHQFIYDGWNLVADVSSAGNTYYIWGPDRDGSLATDSGGVRGLLAIISSGGTTSVSSVYYPVMNNHGDVTALFDSTGTNIVAKYERDPFGVLLSATGPAANACPFGYQTKYTDPETGLIYFGHRYYSPVLGRWMSRDPLAEQGGVNLYSYCNGDPVNKTDPLGLTSDEFVNMVLRVAATELEQLGIKSGSGTLGYAAGAGKSLLENAAYAGSAQSVIEGYQGAVQGTTSVMTQERSRGANLAQVWAVGTGYALGNILGGTPALEGVYGYDWASQTDLHGIDRTMRVVGGAGQMVLTGTGIGASLNTGMKSFVLETKTVVPTPPPLPTAENTALIRHPFTDGGTVIVGKTTLQQLKLRGITSLGRADEGLFVSPKTEIDALLAHTTNPRDIEAALGLHPGSLGDEFIRVDVPDVLGRNLRMPDAKFRINDPYHLPNSGKTIGGLEERVIDPIPMNAFGL